MTVEGNGVCLAGELNLFSNCQMREECDSNAGSP